MDVIVRQNTNRIDKSTSDFCGHEKLSGFTLLELLVAIAVLAITLGIGIPSVSAMVQSNRMAAAINTFSAGFAYTRSAAITRNREVVICKSQDGKYCNRKGGWEQGWIIYEDKNGDELRDKDEALLRVQGSLPPGIKVSFSAYPARAKHFVYYWPTGFTKMNGTFTFCQKNNTQQPKALILSKVGRLRKSETYRDGTPLKCD